MVDKFEHGVGHSVERGLESSVGHGEENKMEHDVGSNAEHEVVNKVEHGVGDNVECGLENSVGHREENEMEHDVEINAEHEVGDAEFEMENEVERAEQTLLEAEKALSQHQTVLSHPDKTRLSDARTQLKELSPEDVPIGRKCLTCIKNCFCCFTSNDSTIAPSCEPLHGLPQIAQEIEVMTASLNAMMTCIGLQDTWNLFKTFELEQAWEKFTHLKSSLTVDADGNSHLSRFLTNTLDSAIEQGQAHLGLPIPNLEPIDFVLQVTGFTAATEALAAKMDEEGFHDIAVEIRGLFSALIDGNKNEEIDVEAMLDQAHGLVARLREMGKNAIAEEVENLRVLTLKPLQTLVAEHKNGITDTFSSMACCYNHIIRSAGNVFEEAIQDLISVGSLLSELDLQKLRCKVAEVKRVVVKVEGVLRQVTDPLKTCASTMSDIAHWGGKAAGIIDNCVVLLNEGADFSNVVSHSLNSGFMKESEGLQALIRHRISHEVDRKLVSVFSNTQATPFPSGSSDSYKQWLQSWTPDLGAPDFAEKTEQINSLQRAVTTFETLLWELNPCIVLKAHVNAARWTLHGETQLDPPNTDMAKGTRWFANADGLSNHLGLRHISHLCSILPPYQQAVLDQQGIIY